MSIQTQIERIKANISAAYSALTAKGATVPTSKTSANLATAIQSISTGVNTSDATATADEILEGKTAYVEGSKVTGTMRKRYKSDISTVVMGEGNYRKLGISLLHGYYSISTDWLFNARPAAVITPGTTDVVISGDTYLEGDQTISGDSNLLPENIKSGVSIFGVEGTLASPPLYNLTLTAESTNRSLFYMDETGWHTAALLKGDTGVFRVYPMVVFALRLSPTVNNIRTFQSISTALILTGDAEYTI